MLYRLRSAVFAFYLYVVNKHLTVALSPRTYIFFPSLKQRVHWKFGSSCFALQNSAQLVKLVVNFVTELADIFNAY